MITKANTSKSISLVRALVEGDKPLQLDGGIIK